MTPKEFKDLLRREQRLIVMELMDGCNDCGEWDAIEAAPDQPACKKHGDIISEMMDHPALFIVITGEGKVTRHYTDDELHNLNVDSYEFRFRKKQLKKGQV